MSISPGDNVGPYRIIETLGQGGMAAVFEKALRLKPDLASAIWRLGDVNRAQGKVAEAMREYTRALVIDPNLPEAHYGLGMLAMGRGANDEARRQFQIVINNPNASPEIKDQAAKQLAIISDKP